MSSFEQKFLIILIMELKIDTDKLISVLMLCYFL